jgi:hypothetical protein
MLVNIAAGLPPTCLSSNDAIWPVNCQYQFMKRNAARYRPEELRFYIHDRVTSFCIEIEGDLSGKGVSQLEESWRTAASVIGNRPLVIAVGNLTSVDSAGHALLGKWRAAGAQFAAKSPSAKTWIAAVTGQAIAPVTEATKQDRRARLRARALPLLAAIGLLFPAAAREIVSAPRYITEGA